jgi:polar amino acid transport system permease protein
MKNGPSLSKSVKNLFVEPEGKKPSNLSKGVNITMVLMVIGVMLIYSVSNLNYVFHWDTVIRFSRKFLNGFLMTIIISLFSLILSMAIGMVNALALQSRLIFFKYLARSYVEIIRGTPFLVQINFIYFIIATALGVNNKYLLGILILSIFSGAYLTEIIRGGMQSIQESQWMSARSLGMTRLQTYRYVVLPQVVKRILPGLAGQLSSLIKDSSLLSVIAVSEFTMNVLEVDAITFNTFENLTFLAVGYLLLTLPISYASKILERKFFYES